MSAGDPYWDSWSHSRVRRGIWKQLGSGPVRRIVSATPYRWIYPPG